MSNTQNEETCTHDCSSCSANCSSKKPESLLEPANEMSEVKRVIGIVSGKGGVGKSLVSTMLSVLMRRRGYNTAVLDADITGPSVPKALGVSGEVTGHEKAIFPLKSKTGIEVMSVNLLLQSEESPVVWRGPVIAGTVKQFWTDVIWGDVDYMFIDMPPGTGDVPLTVFQSIPLDGIIIVTTPQDLVSMIVKKAVNMAKLMNIPVLGFVENMSYAVCPDCGKKLNIFGDSKLDATARELGYEVLGKIPLDSRLASLCDKGIIELFENDYLDAAADAIEKKFSDK